MQYGNPYREYWNNYGLFLRDFISDLQKSEKNIFFRVCKMRFSVSTL